MNVWHRLLRRIGYLVGIISLMVSLTACDPSSSSLTASPLNSAYTDEQPAISGSGRYVSFVSNREGRRQLLLYDLQEQALVNLPRLNRRSTIAESPSISNNARYIVYVTSDRGRPEIELYDRITQVPRVLTTGFRGWVRNPTISPDGRYVAFESDQRGQWDIQIFDRGANVELDLLENQPLVDNQT
ncbi:TolB family protein [Vacuolonema iberomarrocanum]|uniref:TolB family protein n=1 Tax=Vacuolonema iberomarrocanum TaxID=3454632 RepID=UPI0019F3B00A|nr:TolB family protein [filamentous cyanobacterium LEGE 07170]